MSNDLPNPIVEKLERSWAARVAGEAAAWRSERSMHLAQEQVVPRKGRVVPVAFKRRPMRGAAQRI